MRLKKKVELWEVSLESLNPIRLKKNTFLFNNLRKIQLRSYTSS